jgi:hypothetical protein
MATLGTGVYTLIDRVKELDPDGKPAKLINMLAQKDELMPRLPLMECNDGTTHVTTVITALPVVNFREYNEAVSPTKGDSTQERFGTGLVTAFSKVDAKLAATYADPGTFRMNQSQKFVESIRQKMMSTLFYGNAGTSPKAFNGLSRFFNSLSTSTQVSAANVIDAAGTQDSPSDLASIWYVAVGPDTIHGLHPKGLTAGLEHIDRGIALVPGATGATGSILSMLVDEWNLSLGLCVADWRAAGRVVNIDISDRLAATDSVLPNLVRRMVASVEPGTGTPYLVMNRAVKYLFETEVRREVGAGGGLTYENIDNSRLTVWEGIPILRCDGLLSTETAVS